MSTDIHGRETSHPVNVAEVMADDMRAAVVDREAILAHIAICPEYAAFAVASNVVQSYRRRFEIMLGTIRMNGDYPGTCPHQRDLQPWWLDKSEFADTYGEAVALMHQWVAEAQRKEEDTA